MERVPLAWGAGAFERKRPERHKSEVEERTKMKAFDRNYKRLDEVVCAINDLQNEFDENDSKIETVARDCIGETVGYILEWFGIPIGTEEAIRERDW